MRRPGFLRGRGAEIWTRIRRRTRLERLGRRASRSLRIWRLTLRNAVRFVITKVRGRRASNERRAELDETFRIRTAADVATELGQMKGVLMKAGQLMSVLADGLPDEARDALASLQSHAEPMAPSLAASVVTQELGGRPEDVFLDWDPEPAAAASIGQVHRGVLHDGRRVAVKVQYPGAADAIGADLDNAQALYRVAGAFALPGLDTRALVDELRARMTEELDYRIEAANQTYFHRALAGHPVLRVPEVIESRSSARVLTTEWVDGWSFGELLSQGSFAQHQAAGEAVWRFAQHGLHRLGTFNGDPHPGNFLFGSDGTVTCLDFGMVKKYAPGEWERLRPCLDGIIVHRDPEALLVAMVDAEFLDRTEGVDPRAVYDYVSAPYRPYLVDEFTFEPEFVSSALAQVAQIRGDNREVARVLDLPTPFIVLNRVVWGVSGVLAQLRAHGPWRAMLMEYLDPGSPAATPLGAEEQLWWSRRSAVA